LLYDGKSCRIDQECPLPARAELTSGVRQFDIRGLAFCVPVFFGFGIIAYLSIELTTTAGRVASMWPANAILFSALWLLRDRFSYLPALFAAFAGNVVADILQGDTLATAVALSTANITEVTIALLLMTRWNERFTETISLHGMVKFLIICGMIAPVASALISASYFSMTRATPFEITFVDWYMADGLGMIVFAPAILFFRWQEFVATFEPGRHVTTILSWVVFLAIVSFVMWQSQYPLLFAVFPCLVLIVFVGGLSSLSVAIFLISAASIIATANQSGPFALMETDLRERVILLQAFVGAAIFSKFPLAALLISEAKAKQALTEAYDKAEMHRKEAEIANKAKSDFLTHMSHELRTPLNGIHGFTQLLLSSGDKLSGKNRDYAETIHNGSHHLIGIVDDLLDLAKIESNQVQLNIANHSIDQIVREATGLARTIAASKDIAIDVALSGSTEHLDVAIDRPRTVQMLLNLLTNAIKYSPEGSKVLVNVRRTKKHVEVSVEDQGAGIPPEFADSVFEPFNRAAAPGGTDGIGIGLALTQRLADLMGADISHHAAAKTGTVFLLRLPLAETGQSSIGSGNHANQSVRDGTVEQTGDHTREKFVIVYVEDNKTNAKLIQEALSIFPDLELVVAVTADEGLEVVRQVKPELIFLDVHLPDGSGYDLIHKCRSTGLTPLTQIVAITADASQSARARCREAGFDLYLSKPFEVRELQDYVRQRMAVTQSRAAA
jgi:signal transduction histidine kinase/CheY-like chemotaxis protein